MWVLVFFSYDKRVDKTILHIDFDSFFASCEQQFNPRLRGKPLGVTAHNGRTAIIAASREAKAMGVKSPSRTFEAFQICPELILTTSHFEEYWEISKRFLRICSSFSPFVELFSLDEVFMDITKTAHLFGGVQNIISQIRKRILKEIGQYITVSIGISYNKLLSKLASGLKKPVGTVFITRQNLFEIYKSAKLTDICGIGNRIELRLNAIGVFNLLQLQTVPYYRLVNEFGIVEAQFLKQVGLGIDSSEVIPYTDTPQVKSVGRNYCLPQNEYRERIVLQNMYELCEEIAIKLRRLHKKARTLGLFLSGAVAISQRQTFSDYFDSGKEIYNRCLLFIRQQKREHFLSSNEYIRQIGIWVSSLEDSKDIQLFLFEKTLKNQKLQKIVDSLNEKFGDHTIRNGFLLYADKLTTEPNGFMADKYERTKLALVS